jgi:hypothetical protein
LDNPDHGILAILSPGVPAPPPEALLQVELMVPKVDERDLEWLRWRHCWFWIFALLGPMLWMTSALQQFLANAAFEKWGQKRRLKAVVDLDPFEALAAFEKSCLRRCLKAVADHPPFEIPAAVVVLELEPLLRYELSYGR